MGFRSPYRFAIDDKSQTVITGNVGPDASQPNPTRGPAAHDELEVVPKGGATNHGWPRCIANNIPYNEYDWSTNQAGAALSCDGMTPAAFYYTYQPSPTTNLWVQMGRGCNTAMAGVTYRSDVTGSLRLPARFNDTLLWFEWCRGAALTLPLRADGSIGNAVTDVSVAQTGLSNPIDMATGPD